jgi:hypothetical protein
MDVGGGEAEGEDILMVVESDEGVARVQGRATVVLGQGHDHVVRLWFLNKVFVQFSSSAVPHQNLPHYHTIMT